MREYDGMVRIVVDGKAPDGAQYVLELGPVWRIKIRIFQLLSLLVDKKNWKGKKKMKRTGKSPDRDINDFVKE